MFVTTDADAMCFSEKQQKKAIASVVAMAFVME